jgi:hypothetical protein
MQRYWGLEYGLRGVRDGLWQWTQTDFLSAMQIISNVSGRLGLSPMSNNGRGIGRQSTDDCAIVLVQY